MLLCGKSNKFNCLTKEISHSRPCIEDNLDSLQMKVSEFSISTSSQSKGGSPAVSDRELRPHSIHLLQYGLQSQVYI